MRRTGLRHLDSISIALNNHSEKDKNKTYQKYDLQKTPSHAAQNDNVSVIKQNVSFSPSVTWGCGAYDYYPSQNAYKYLRQLITVTFRSFLTMKYVVYSA